MLAVWTWGYSAFTMGGTTQYRIVAELPILETREHRGVTLARVQVGTSSVIAETSSGAICGHDMDSVCADMAEMSDADVLALVAEMNSALSYRSVDKTQEEFAVIYSNAK